MANRTRTTSLGISGLRRASWCFLAVLLLQLIEPERAVACHLTQLTLDSVTNPASGVHVVMATLCIGAGRTGTTGGGDGPTRSIAFGFNTVSQTFALTSFAPESITSDFTAQTMPAYLLGPSPFPYDSTETIFYYMEEWEVVPFTCSHDTATCGPVHSDCNTFEWTMNELPDAIKTYGPEGNDNPVSGCYSHADMNIDFTIDTDGDGILEYRDNCPATLCTMPTASPWYPECVAAKVNPGQEDLDMDGLGDACDPPVCGNGFIEPGEQCDDAGVANDDGCSSVCQTEPGSVCTGQPSVCAPFVAVPALGWPGLLALGLLLMTSTVVVSGAKGDRRQTRG